MCANRLAGGWAACFETTVKLTGLAVAFVKRGKLTIGAMHCEVLTETSDCKERKRGKLHGGMLHG